MLHAELQNNMTFSSGENIIKGFYHIWALWPSWSCNRVNFLFNCLAFSTGLHTKVCFDLSKGLRGRIKIVVIYMNISPGQGQATT